MNVNNNRQLNKHVVSIWQNACFTVAMPSGVYADTALFSCGYFNSC